MEMPINRVYAVHVDCDGADTPEVHHFVATSLKTVVDASSSLYTGNIVAITIGPEVVVL